MEGGTREDKRKRGGACRRGLSLESKNREFSIKKGANQRERTRGDVGLERGNRSPFFSFVFPVLLPYRARKEQRVEGPSCLEVVAVVAA